MYNFKKIEAKCREMYTATMETKQLLKKNTTNILAIQKDLEKLSQSNPIHNEDSKNISGTRIQNTDDDTTEFNKRLQEGISRLEKAGAIGKEHLDGCIVLADREDALELIPKHGITAEVGVAYGDFSSKIIEKCDPTKFYAIDYFSQDDPYCNFWGRDLFRKDNMPHQEWYEHRFKSFIQQGIVETKQGFSWDILSTFENDYFDYVYLDAGHDYESVHKDICVLKDKVKSGGFIQFNDYTVFSILEDAFYGIVPAVNEFINDPTSKHKVKAFCLQQNGYYDLLLQIFK